MYSVYAGHSIRQYETTRSRWGWLIRMNGIKCLLERIVAKHSTGSGANCLQESLCAHLPALSRFCFLKFSKICSHQIRHVPYNFHGLDEFTDVVHFAGCAALPGVGQSVSKLLQFVAAVEDASICGLVFSMEQFYYRPELRRHRNCRKRNCADLFEAQNLPFENRRQHMAKGNKTSYDMPFFHGICWLYFVMSPVSRHV